MKKIDEARALIGNETVRDIVNRIKLSQRSEKYINHFYEPEVYDFDDVDDWCYWHTYHKSELVGNYNIPLKSLVLLE